MPQQYECENKNKFPTCHVTLILEIGTKFKSHSQIAASKFNISEHLVFDQNCMKFWLLLLHLKVKYSKFKLSDDAGAT